MIDAGTCDSTYGRYRRPHESTDGLGPYESSHGDGTDDATGDVSDRSSPYDATSYGTTSDDASNGSTDAADPSSSNAHESQTSIPGRTYGTIEMVMRDEQ